MFGKCCLLAILCLIFTACTACLDCEAQTRPEEFGAVPTPRDALFTLQLSSFPSAALATKFADELREAGEKPICVPAQIPGHGVWTRVLTGAFDSLQAARRYGRALVAKGLAKSFLVRRHDELNGSSIFGGIAPGAAPDAVAAPSKSNETNRESLQPSQAVIKQAVTYPRGSAIPGLPLMNAAVVKFEPIPLQPLEPVNPIELLPSGNREGLWVATSLAPEYNVSDLPLADPFRKAFGLVLRSPSGENGGLWLTGDTRAGLSVLQLIVGGDNADAVVVDAQGRVDFNTSIIEAKIGAKSEANGHRRPLGLFEAEEYINSNEGLLLLIQLTQGSKRYQFTIGDTYLTLAGALPVAGAMNVDCMFDSRINPRRPGLKKREDELPPSGFEAAVAINPSARWINVPLKRLVPLWIIAFHELAEAYSKVELGLDYLPLASRPGAHQMAVERELILRSERRASDLVLTAGTNIVFNSARDMAKYLENKSLTKQKTQRP